MLVIRPELMEEILIDEESAIENYQFLHINGIIDQRSGKEMNLSEAIKAGVLDYVEGWWLGHYYCLKIKNKKLI